jgi:ribosome recycling factor
MLEEDISMIIEMAQESMDQSLEHLQKELVKIRTGKASPAMLGGLLVPYYGSPTPLNQVSNVSTSDARTLVIQPWEKSMLAPIEKAIFEANLGVTPQNNGEIIIINIPPLTEERRRDLVKNAKALGEDSKVSIRNARRDAINELKKAVKDGLPEDIGKRKEGEVEELTKKYQEKVDAMIAAKEKDIMTI